MILRNRTISQIEMDFLKLEVDIQRLLLQNKELEEENNKLIIQLRDEVMRKDLYRDNLLAMHRKAYNDMSSM